MKIVRVVLAALLSVAGWAAPAAGVVLPPGDDIGEPAWPVAADSLRWLQCDGSIGALHALTPQDSPPGAVLVDYTFYPCLSSTNTTKTVYAVAVYYPSIATGWASWLTSGRRSAVVQVGPSAQAVCLISSPTQRVACAEIAWGSDGLPALGPVLPLDAPAVSMPVGSVWKPEGQVVVPVCPVCT